MRPSCATLRMAAIMGCEFVPKRACRHFYQRMRVEFGPHHHECIHCGHVR